MRTRGRSDSGHRLGGDTPELLGLDTQGDGLEEVTDTAREALTLYIDGLREDGAASGDGHRPAQAPLPA